MLKRLPWPGMIALVLVSLFVAGCGDQRIIERLGFTQTVSLDLANEDEESKLFIVGATIPKADPEGKIEREVISAEARSLKEGFLKHTRTTELRLVGGQIRNTMYGISVAKKGIWDHVHDLIRDPAISGNVKITIVNGRAIDLLSKDFPENPRTGQYVDRLLEKESKGLAIPRVTIHDFARDYYDDGIDPVAPVVKMVKDQVQLDGIALFQDDRYIAKISDQQGLYFSLLYGRVKGGLLNLEIGGNESEDMESILLNSVTSSRKIKVNRLDERDLSVQIEIKARGSLLGYTGELDLSDEQDRRKLTVLIEEAITKEAETIVKTMQQHQTDSIGIGQYVRNSMSYSEWKELDWREAFAELNVRIDTKFEINDYGNVN